MEIDWTIPNIWGTSASPWAQCVDKMWTRSVFVISLSEFNRQHIAIGIMYELQNNMEFAIIIRKLVGIVESCGESLNSPSVTLARQRLLDFLLGVTSDLTSFSHPLGTLKSWGLLLSTWSSFLLVICHLKFENSRSFSHFADSAACLHLFAYLFLLHDFLNHAIYL